MAIIDKYESKGRHEYMDYVVFFCDMPEHDGWADAVMMTEDTGLPSGETMWCIGNIQLPADEISKFAVAAEIDDQDYSCDGWSIACTSFDEMIDELRRCEFEDGYEIEEDTRAFFAQ